MDNRVDNRVENGVATRAGKRLIVVRHAKSSRDNADLEDHERPLNGRGRAAAEKMALYIRDHEIRPDLVLCSSAARTQQTLELLRVEASAQIEDELYGATAGEWMARLWEVTTADCVLLMGHNPGVQDLTIGLVGDADGLQDFPTCALADLNLAVDTWEDVCPGSATLRAFVLPRTLP